MNISFIIVLSFLLLYEAKTLPYALLPLELITPYEFCAALELTNPY